MYNNFKYQRCTNFCLNNTIPIADIFLDQVKSFVNYNKIEPTFTYAFLIEVTHYDFNNAQLIDEHFAQFIRTMNERLKDMVFILMVIKLAKMFSVIIYKTLSKREITGTDMETFSKQKSVELSLECLYLQFVCPKRLIQNISI